MRLDEPRVEPLPCDQLHDELKSRLGDKPLNIFRTLGHHPKLLKRWLVFGNHILAKNSLSPRDREIAILRVGWLCRAGYEWAQHVVIGKDEGLDDADIDRITKGADAPGWTPAETALLRATDELHEDTFVSDTTFAELADHYSTQQVMDFIFTVGQYHLVSMALNTLGVQLDAGLDGMPER
ncbi:MAG: carboxymuconolactone decarboxylase family protein [bacterium]|nr:carboxymuconolactone decarboxylase family protein [bacterium]MCP5043243.1 carboxymuconolactone decarboxylase family protein [bacterium]